MEFVNGTAMFEKAMRGRTERPAVGDVVMAALGVTRAFVSGKSCTQSWVGCPYT